MSEHVLLLSIPALREKDLPHMPALAGLVARGDRAPLAARFPAVTCPVQVNMTTGVPPNEHGVVGNGFFWREKNTIEMWTAWNDAVQRPQIWDRLKQYDSAITSAVWFPLLAKGCGADYACTPAPIHNPDGSESLWCYTKPELLYGELRDELGHFPLKHFWGPLAGIASSAWIVSSAIVAARRYHPNFFFVYLPHLDYAAQKHGPDSKEATEACRQLDGEIARLVKGFSDAYAPRTPLWLVASEYVILPVTSVSFPNRILRKAGLLALTQDETGRENLDVAASQAWALADHQLAHLFVRDRDPATINHIAGLFHQTPGVAQVLVGDERARLDLDHDRSGDVILVSKPESWFAYYWWTEDQHAPTYARTVDIHRKPGYDPVELFFDPVSQGIPLDASLVRGSHGAPTIRESQRGVVLSSQRGAFVERTMGDTDIADLVLRQFGV